MATELAKAYVQIVPSAEGISSGIQSTLEGAGIDSAANSVGSNFGKTFLGVAGGVIAAGAAAISTAATAVWNSANELASTGDTIDKQSQKIGVTAEQYQTLSYAAEHCGFSVSSFQTAAKSLANTDFDGSVWDAVEAIQAIEDPAERSAKAQELLGTRSAQEMAALINGTESIDEYKASLEDLGGMLSDDTVSASAAFEDSLTDLQTAFGGIKNGLIEDFLPSITTVMDGLTALFSGDEGGIEMINQGISDFLGNMSDMIPQMLDVASDIMLALLDAIIDNLPQIIEGGINIVIKLAVGIVKAIPKLVAKIPQIILALVNGLKNGVGSLLSVGGDLIKGLWNGISNKITWIKEKIKGFGQSVLNSIKSIFGIHSPSKEMAWMGEMMDQGLANGIEDNTSVIDDAMNSVTKATMGTISANVGAVGGAVAGNNTNVTLNVYGAQGQNVRDLANIVMAEIQYATNRKAAVFG